MPPRLRWSSTQVLTAVDFTGLAAEIATEVRLLRGIGTELAAHAAEREAGHRQVDPACVARSLPGLAEVGGPALAACMGDPAPVRVTASSSAPTPAWPPKPPRPARPTAKASPCPKPDPPCLRTTLVRAADTARKQDPQLARLYHQQMTERGKDHLGATCVVAAALAERAWTVMRRGQPYTLCDTDGRPVTPAEAKEIIARRWTVPPEIRARPRSKKTGKAPQKAREGQYARGGLPQHTTPPRQEKSVKANP